MTKMVRYIFCQHYQHNAVLDHDDCFLILPFSNPKTMGWDAVLCFIYLLIAQVFVSSNVKKNS